MISRKRSFPFIVIALLWFIGISISYFVNHKPFSPALAMNAGRSLWQILIACMIISIGGGLGVRIAPLSELAPPVRLTVHAGLGLGILGLLILFVGSIIGFHPLLLGAILVLLLFFLGRQILSWLGNWRELICCWRASGLFELGVISGSALILLFTLLISLAPPLKFDALVYHLVLPQVYINTGRLTYLPWNAFWGMPQTAEMLFTSAISLAGVESATALGWMFGLITLIGVLGFASERLGFNAGLVAVASLLSGLTIAVSLSWGYVDWLVMLFGICLLISLAQWHEYENKTYLLLAGSFAGFALGTKYTAGVLLLCGIGVVLLVSPLKRSRFENLPFLIIPAGLIALPWWLKNWAATGNPWYPFLFSAGAMDQMRISLYQAQPAWGDWKDFLFLPIRATLLGSEGGIGYGASLGPVFLGLGVLSWIGWSKRNRRQRSVISTASIMAVTGLAVWALLSRFSMLLIQSRLYFGLLPPFAILSAAGFLPFQSRNLAGIRLKRIVGFFILFLLWVNVLEVGVNTVRTGVTQELLGVNTSQEYLADNLGWYVPAMEAIRDLPAGSRVLLLWEPRSFHCMPKCFPDEVLDRWAHDLHKMNDPYKVLDTWKSQGYTHLLYYRAGADYVRAHDLRYVGEDWKDLDRLLSKLSLSEEFGGVYYLYSLSS